MIIASLCTIPSRKNNLKKTIESILPNVDKLNVFLNGYQQTPDFLLNNDKITVENSNKWGDKGDANKFFWSDKIDNNSYHFVCDDDIIYKKAYFDHMINKLKVYNHKVIVSLCGSRILKSQSQFSSYYRSRHPIHIRRNIDRDLLLNIIGTGAMCYHTKYIKLIPDIFKQRNMADIWLGIHAKKNRIPLIRVSLISHTRYVVIQKIDTATIHRSSTTSINNKMNTALIQTRAIKNNYPWTCTFKDSKISRLNNRTLAYLKRREKNLNKKSINKIQKRKRVNKRVNKTIKKFVFKRKTINKAIKRNPIINKAIKRNPIINKAIKKKPINNIINKKRKIIRKKI